MKLNALETLKQIKYYISKQVYVQRKFTLTMGVTLGGTIFVAYVGYTHKIHKIYIYSRILHVYPHTTMLIHSILGISYSIL